MPKLKIKKVMKEKKMTEYALAKAMGKTQPNVARWLKAESDPKFSVLVKIADKLGVKVKDLIEE